MGAGVKECGGGVELVGRKGGLGGARAGGGLSSPDSVRAGLAVGGGSDYVFWEGIPPRDQDRVRGRGSPELRVRGVEGAGLRWRGRGGALRLALAAVPPERREARSALARAPAAGLGGGAGTRAAGFPRRDPEGSGPGDRVWGFAQGRCWGPRQSVGLAVCDAVV